MEKKLLKDLICDISYYPNNMNLKNTGKNCYFDFKKANFIQHLYAGKHYIVTSGFHNERLEFVVHSIE